MNHYFDTHKLEQDGLVIVPVKIRFDEIYQFVAGPANVSVATFPNSLYVETYKKSEASWYHILTGRIKEQDCLLTVPANIRFDETYPFAAGSAYVSVTRFAGRSENSEGLVTSDIGSKTDRSETAR